MANDERWKTSNSAYGGWWSACLPPMVSSRQHVPKVNNQEVVKRQGTPGPSSEDRSKLHQTLAEYCLEERIVRGDGNCQFRALSDQMYQEEAQHRAVRQGVVEQLQIAADKYRPYVPEDYEQYVRKMSSDGYWGDHVTLQACADKYGIPIYLITSYGADNVIQVKPEKVTSESALWLSFWAEIHYNSIVPKST